MTRAATEVATAARPARRPSIDMLRSVAICLMILVHFVENLSARFDPAGGAVADWLPAGAAAPIFTFLAGVNYRLWCEPRLDAGETSAAVSRASVRRGLFLLAVGLAFNVLVWLPADTFNWDVLTFLGLAILVLDVVRRMPPAAAVLAVGLVVVVSPVLRVIVDYPAYWQQGWFDYDFTLRDVLVGCLVVGYFPLFPWLAFPLAGYLAADLVFPPGRPVGARPTGAPPVGAPPAALGPPLFVAAVLAAAAGVTLAVWPRLPAGLRGGAPDGWTMFPASTAYLLGSTATTLVALAVLHRLLDAGPPTGWRRSLAGWTGPFSRHAFSIYVLHHLVHVWPLWLAGLAAGDDPTAFWQAAVPVPVAVGLAVACCAVLFPLFAWIDRHRVPTLERAMRWLCD